MKRIAVVLSLAVVACAPTPKELAAQAAADSKSLLREALETGQLTNSWQSIDELFKSTDSTAKSSRPQVPATSSSDSLMELLELYSEQIFAESNVVERPVGALVFGLSGNILCTDPRTKAVPNADCVAQVDKLQLRLKATAGPDLTLQLGPDRIEPVVLKIRAKVSLSLEQDLDATQKAAVFVNQTLGNTSPLNGISISSKGRVEVKLLKNGDHDFTVSYANLAPIEVKYVDATGIERSWANEARNPVASLRVEGPAKKLTVLVDYGKFEGKGMSNDYFPLTYPVAQADGGTTYVAAAPAPISYLLSGVSAELRLAEGQATTVKGIGLGNEQSSITYNGRKLASIDLNAALGRKFDVALKSTGAGLRADFTPGVEASVYLGLAALPAEVKVDPNFLDSTFTGSFTANGSPASIQVIPSNGSKAAALQIVTGTLTLSTSQSGFSPKTFTAGTCLNGKSSTTQHPVLDAISSVACP